MDRYAYFILLAAIALGVIGQILLKRGMSRKPEIRLLDIWKVAGDLSILGGFFSYGISILLYFLALANLDLSLAYPTVSLGYVATTVLSRVLFDEQVSLARWAAIFLICVGVGIVGLGAA